MQEKDNLQNDIVNKCDTTYISVDEMAKLLSIARITAYQLTKMSGFPCFHIGKRIIIPLRAFHEWAEGQASQQSVIFAK